MAGAISAGAYTAGVMDYLLEALENWQKAREMGLPGVPSHEVVIEVMTGASAGGMTAILAAAAMKGDFPHISARNLDSPDIYLNPLFDAWVNLSGAGENAILEQMLDNSDLDQPAENMPVRPVASLFNSGFVEQVARRVVDDSLTRTGRSRPYLAGDFELLTTLTNLDGYRCELDFETSTVTRQETMTVHRDFLHFRHDPSGLYRGDGKIPFHFCDSSDGNRSLLIDAAVATGAFPVGLAPRLVTRKAEYINENALLKINHDKPNLVCPVQDYTALCVDGGVLNNEPYDLAEAILAQRSALRNGMPSGEAAAQFNKQSFSASGFENSVLVIDPFPGYEEELARVPGLPTLKYSLEQLPVAMHRQLLAKTELMKKVYNDDDFSRYMIAPVRTSGGIQEKYSLACGSAWGFGGFFSRDFRVHDFLLGRRNCQRFLREHYCVPEEAGNPVITRGYALLSQRERRSYLASDGRRLPVIPDIRISPDGRKTIAPEEEKEFPYPWILPGNLARQKKLVRKRFYRVVRSVSSELIPEDDPEEVKQPHKGIHLLKMISFSAFGNLSRPVICLLQFAGAWYAAGRFLEAVIRDMEKRGLTKSVD